MTPEDREPAPRSEGQSLTDWRLETLEKHDATHFQTADKVIALEKDRDSHGDDIKDLRSEVSKLRTALYTTAGSLFVSSLLFVFGILQLKGG